MLLIMIFNWDIKSLQMIVYVKRSQAIKVVKFKLANYLNLMLLFICVRLTDVIFLRLMKSGIHVSVTIFVSCVSRGGV